MFLNLRNIILKIKEHNFSHLHIFYSLLKYVFLAENVDLRPNPSTNRRFHTFQSAEFHPPCLKISDVKIWGGIWKIHDFPLMFDFVDQLFQIFRNNAGVIFLGTPQMYLSRLGHDPIANNTPVALGDEARFARIPESHKVTGSPVLPCYKSFSMANWHWRWHWQRSTVLLGQSPQDLELHHAIRL